MSYEDTQSQDAEISVIPFIFTSLDELYLHKSEDKTPLFLIEPQEATH